MNILDPTTLIPFLNQYNLAIRLVVIISLIIACGVWFFVLPKKQYKNLARTILFLSIIIVIAVLVLAYPRKDLNKESPQQPAAVKLKGIEKFETERVNFKGFDTPIDARNVKDIRIKDTNMEK